MAITVEPVVVVDRPCRSAELMWWRDGAAGLVVVAGVDQPSQWRRPMLISRI
ncbi:hypothetical protein [Streptomyces sp. NPDC058398]|uniref:hypothetical protein n=1 Tax=Streptomyces sp. NPDC058398 TaxID=3346479 RepID=UPI0036566505